MYICGGPVDVGTPDVVDSCCPAIVDPDVLLVPPPSVNSPDRIAKNAKMPVLHTRYVWSRVRKNINPMLGLCVIGRTDTFHRVIRGPLS